jgi:hypothetical protein
MMSIVAEPTTRRHTLSLLSEPSAAPLADTARRQVVVVVDACCDIDPAAAASLGILILPRAARADGRAITLSSEQTLHASCWPRAQRIIPEPHALGTLAKIYERVLRDGLSVLAMHLPGRLDGTTRVALAARSILLAGRVSAAEPAPRIAVYEPAAVGQNFAWLVAAAARGAAAGLALHQLLTLLDRLQAAQRSVYLTGVRGPLERTRRPGRAARVARLGREQLWALDPADGLFVCQARGWDLARMLFRDGGPLHGVRPTAAYVYNTRLVERVNAGRAQAQLPPLEVHPGGLSLAPLFPGGCLEIAAFPDEEQIAHIADVIRRIDRPREDAPRGVRERGGI